MCWTSQLRAPASCLDVDVKMTLRSRTSNSSYFCRSPTARSEARQGGQPVVPARGDALWGKLQWATALKLQGSLVSAGSHGGCRLFNRALINLKQWLIKMDLITLDAHDVLNMRQKISTNINLLHILDQKCHGPKRLAPSLNPRQIISTIRLPRDRLSACLSQSPVQNRKLVKKI